MSTYVKQMQKIVAYYREAGEPWPTSTRNIAAWAMREEYITDAKGRRIRVKHPVTVRHHGEQMVLWDDMRTAPREHMRLSFQQRRQQTFGDCRHLKTDLDSYHERNPTEKPIQIVFDFTRDLAEWEAAA